MQQANSTKRRLVETKFDNLFGLFVAKCVDRLGTQQNVGFTSGTFSTQKWLPTVIRTSFIQSRMKKGAEHKNNILFWTEIFEIENN